MCNVVQLLVVIEWTRTGETNTTGIGPGKFRIHFVPIRLDHWA